jgi:filamentous hemagglutinin family protein
MNKTSRRSRGPAAARSLPLKKISAGVLAAHAGGALALPSGGQLVAGQGSVASSGGTMTVTQQSQSMSLNWQGFSIGSGETVRFNQPSSASIALNRVIGNDPSAIYGNLSANGQVFLVNPNGILFAPGSQVNVGGLLASTLDVASGSDAANGKFKLVSPSNRPGTVVNQGTISASPGGYVALLGGQVSNQGTISAQLGKVALAAGQAMTLDFGGNKLLNLKIDQGALGALAENRQLIQADGGSVLMTAYARDALLDTVVNNSGIIEARTLDGQSGTIRLLGDFSGGTVQAGGRLDASSPASLNPNGGDGGFIDTSGAHVKVNDSLSISTRAANGATGTWLIDPADYNIAATGGDMTGAALSAALAGSNVTILSSAGASSAGGGDINVKDNVSWSANTLTLTAARDINVSAVMSASGSAALTMNTNTANGADAAAGSGYVNMALTPNGFTGRIDYSASGALKINGETYVVVRDVATLQTMTRNVSFALGSDIDASSVADFTPLDLGPFNSPTNVQGLGHVVRNYNSTQGGLIQETGGGVQNIGITGNVSGGGAAGGLLNSFIRYSIRNSFSTANVTSTGLYVGGLAGSANEIVNSWATGNVSGDEYVGGLVGSGGTIINSWATGNVNSTATNFLTGDTGGLAGRATRVVNSFATGDVTGQYGTAGGLVGTAPLSGNEIVDSYATGNVSVASNGNVGGLVGSSSANISRSYATGAVSGSIAGGLVGLAYAGITDSYATGGATVSNGMAGGLVGQLTEGAAITRSYASGAVSGNSPTYLGGLVGGNTGLNNAPVITDSFWNTETTGMSRAVGGILSGSLPVNETNVVGATSAELGQASTGSFYTANAGNWDFANTWYAGRGTGAGPILRTSPFTVKVTVASASGTAGALPTPTATYSGNLWAGDTTALFSLAPLTSASSSSPAGTYDWGVTASGTSLTGQRYTFIYDPVTPAPTLTLVAAPVNNQPVNASPGYIGALNYVGGPGGAGSTAGNAGDAAGNAAGEAANGGAQKGKGSGAQGEGGAPLIGVQGSGMRLPPGVQ